MGCVDGIVDSFNVGAEEGFKDGFFDGNALGLPDIRRVGLSECCFVGVKDGFFEGRVVGIVCTSLINPVPTTGIFNSETTIGRLNSATPMIYAKSQDLQFCFCSFNSIESREEKEAVCTEVKQTRRRRRLRRPRTTSTVVVGVCCPAILKGVIRECWDATFLSSPSL